MAHETEQTPTADAGPVDLGLGGSVPECDPVVGHKTYRDGPLGFRHEPLRSSEAVVIMAAVEAATQRRAELMPDEQAAIRMMFEARQRLMELGWNDAIYCPKDGSEFDAIEAGSTGIHRCHYSGEWPNGGWWVADDGDLYPSRPVLYRKPPNVFCHSPHISINVHRCVQVVMDQWICALVVICAGA